MPRASGSGRFAKTPRAASEVPYWLFLKSTSNPEVSQPTSATHATITARPSACLFERRIFLLLDGHPCIEQHSYFSWPVTLILIIFSQSFNERNKSNFANILIVISSFCSPDFDQALDRVRLSNWQHHHTTNF